MRDIQQKMFLKDFKDASPVFPSPEMLSWGLACMKKTYLIFSQSMPSLAILSVNVLRLMPR
jgi:hypothetical protein